MHNNEKTSLVLSASRAATAGPPRRPGPRWAGANQSMEDDGLIFCVARQAIVQWWKAALFSGLILASVACLLVLFFFQPGYRATALLQIEEHAPFVVDQVGPVSSRYVPTQIEILRSRIVLDPVIRQPEVAELAELHDVEDACHSLLKRIRVTTVGASELYEVSCAAYTPEVAKRLTNLIVDSYFQYRARSESQRTRRVIELLDAENVRRERKLETLRSRFRDLGERAAQTGALADSSMTTSLGSSLTGEGGTVSSSLQDRITMAQVEQQVLRAKLKALDEQPGRAKNVSEVEVAAAVDSDPRVIQAESRLAEQNRKLQQVGLTAAGGKESESFRRTELEVRREEVLLAQLRESLRPAAIHRLQSIASVGENARRREMVEAVESYRLMEETLTERRDEQFASRGVASSLLVDLEFARAELQQEENAHKMLAQRATTLRTELGAPEQVTLLRHAELPLRPVTQLPWKQLAAGMFGGMGLPFGLAVCVELVGRRVRCREQLEQSIDAPVVAEITRLPRSANPRRALLLADDREQLYTESVDRLAASILLSSHDRPMQVLAVMSAIPGEGKTRTAIQLSMSLERLQQAPSLLIDADLRRPDVHEMLGIDVGPGLSEVIDEGYPLGEAVRAISEKLHVLTAGSGSRHPRDFLRDARFLLLLKEVRNNYSRIILDTPPLLPASEGLFVAGAADGVILCARRNHSHEPSVRKAIDELTATGVQPFGIVLSGIPRKQYSSHYGSYSYRYNQYPTRADV